VSGIVSAKFPSVTALALSLVASCLLLALIRVVFARLVTISDITDDKSNVNASELGAHSSRSPNPSETRDSQSTKYGALSRWSWSKSSEGLPMSLPAILASSEKDGTSVDAGRGVAAAMQQQQQDQERQPPKMTWQKHRRSPGFVAPLPALYDTPVPMSMAKMIMSRHTYRRPSPNRTPPRSVPIQVRPVSQPPSRPLHSMV